MNNKKSLQMMLVATLGMPALSQASGYAVNEQSASGMGNAYAGRAALAEDASVVFYNPAAMGLLETSQLSGGFGYLNVSTDFDLESATSTYGTPLPGSEGGDFVPDAYIPYFYYTQPINDQIDLGVGIFAPFGTSGEYSEDFVGAGFADETTLQSVALRVAGSYQLTEEFSLGLAVDYITMSGTLSKNVDLLHPAYDQVNNSYAGYENHYEVSGDGSGVRVGFGALYQLEDTNFGFNYNSEVDVTLEGVSSFRNDNVAITTPIPTAPFLAAPTPLTVADQDSEVPLTLPQSATFSVVHRIDELQLQAGATWTGWSSFQYLDIFGTQPSTLGFLSQLDAQGNQIGHIVEKWDDVWAFALGASYQLNDQWLLRAGYAFDESPIADEHRTARVPSTDRQWLTAGARFQATSEFSVDGAIGYLFMDKTEIDEYNYGLDDERKVLAATQQLDPSNLKGEYDINAFGLSIQFNYSL